MSPASSRPATGPGPARPEEGRSSLLAAGSLVLLAFLVYGVPSLAGHPVVPGDDLTQNLPLRELVGRELSHGHLPLFDPYIWSGTPLLAGWNAGAAYPLTWLFAVLPASVAWPVNLIAVSAVAGVGCFAFLRASGLGVLASWLGGLTYAFAGGMAAQTQHIGLVAGMSWVPVALLALNRLTAPATGAGAVAPSRRVTGGPGGPSASRGVGRRAGWTAGLAASVGLVILAGEPRAISDAAVVLVLYALWRLFRLWRVVHLDRLEAARRAALRAGAGVVAGCVLGVGLGAVQLLPGLAAVTASQRGAASAYLFSAGSLPVRWLLLLGVPDLLGGSGSFGQPVYFASYNLTEVTGYVGVLALVAAGALIGRALAPPRRGVPEWAIWYVVAAAGVLLALGNHVPFWHLLVRVPLFGGQRLQSRSILATDLALAVLLAYWLDGWLSAGARVSFAERAAGSIPALAVAGAALGALVDGPAFAEWMGVTANRASEMRGLAPWFVPPLVLGGLAIALLWSGARARPVALRTIVSSYVVIDLTVFVLSAVVAAGAGAAIGGHAGVAGRGGAAAGSASAVRPISALRIKGRFAVYDPTLVGRPRELGVPDGNVLAGTYSVQGYGSIVDARYARAAGVHGLSGEGQDVFAPAAARDGVFDSLDTTDLFAPAQSFTTRLSDRGSSPPSGPASNGPGARRLTPAPSASAGDRVRPGRATWYLGVPHSVTSVVLRTRGGGDVKRVGILTPSGRTVWASTPVAEGRTVRAVWPRPQRAVGIVASAGSAGGTGGSGIVVEPPVVATTVGRFELDGALQSAVFAPHWAYAGVDGAFAIFRNRRADPPLRLRAAPGARLAGATVRQISGPRLEPASAEVASPHGAEVVRGVADVPGWQATWTPAGGDRSHPLMVRRLGVVQVVRVPAGRGVVAWYYAAPRFLTGAWLTAGALAVVLVLAGVALGAPVREARRTRSHGRRLP